jgi:hypothetical protein
MQIEDSMDVEKAQQLLTQEQYDRIRQSVIINEINNNQESIINFMLFQELTYGDPWDTANDQTFRTLFETSYKRIPCHDSLEGNLQRVYIRKQSPWKPIQSYDLVSPILEGGCLIKFVYTENDDDDYDYDEKTIQVLCNNNNNNNNNNNSDNNVDPEVIDYDLVNFCNTIQNNKLYLVNLHGEPNGMRNPTQLQNGMIELWNEIEQLLITNSSRTTEQQQQQQQQQNDFIETELYSIHNDNNDDDNQTRTRTKTLMILNHFHGKIG